MVLAILTAWIALLLAAQWRWPAVISAVDSWPRWFRNLALGLIALIAAPLALWVFEQSSAQVPPLFTAPIWLQLIALDLWTYGMHRAYHRVPMLWRFHVPHHLDEHLDVTSAFRFHAGEILISGIARIVPALLLGIDVQTLIVFEAILLASAAFHHSNIKLPHRVERVLAWVIVTPSIHWVHHHNIRADTDANYAAILSVWDIAFGSKSKTKRWPDMPIGCEGAPEATMARLLMRPFVSPP